MKIKQTMKDLEEFGTVDMECDGYKASIQKAARLKGEGVHGLPQGTGIKAYETSFFPSAPRHWLREKGCYVVPVSKEWGLWFNWTMNDMCNTAIVSSVKGMNPVTGQKMTGVALEDYINKCPIHDLAFGVNPTNAMETLFCSECGYSWPHHNYVSHPNTLWWDGFRQPDGTVRQFFFTEDEERDVASAVIGKENTVPAFGFAFYKTKTARRGWAYTNRYAPGEIGVSGCAGNGNLGGNYNFYDQMVELDKYHKWSQKEKYRGGRGLLRSSGYFSGTNYEDSTNTIYTNSTFTGSNLDNQQAKYLAGQSESLMSCNVGGAGAQEFKSEERVETTYLSRDVSVGAGAQINQSLQKDNDGIAAFKSEPESCIRVYFCFIEHFNEIVKGGLSLPMERKRGFLADKVKVG